MYIHVMTRFFCGLYKCYSDNTSAAEIYGQVVAEFVYRFYKIFHTMSVVAEMTPGVTTTAQPTVVSCSAALDTSDTRSGVRERDERSQLVPSACRSNSPRPSNGLTFSRRRHSKSLDSPYISRPRMKRRGAVSYDKNDAAAEYIRYLGEFYRKKSALCTVLMSVFFAVSQVTH